MTELNFYQQNTKIIFTILFLTIFFFQSSIVNAADPILENADSVFFALNTELEKPTVKPLPKPMVNNPNAAILFRINQPIEFGGLSTSTRPLIINPSSAIIKPLIFPKNLTGKIRIPAEKPKLEWWRSFGDNEYDVAYSIVATQNGYVVAGLTTKNKNEDVLILKLNKDGYLEWQRTYGGSNSDGAYSIVDANGYIIAGYTTSFANSMDAYLLKIDNNGNLEWQRNYGGDAYDIFYAVENAQDGYVAVGTTSFGNMDVYVVKVGKDGNLQWQKTYGGKGNDVAYSITKTSDGFAIAGYTTSFGDGKQAYLIKIDSNGNLKWQKTYGGRGDDIAYSIAKTSDGFVIAGETENRAWLIKTDENGNVRWQRAFDLQSVARSVIVNDGYVIAGSKLNSTWEVYLIKVDKNGCIEWQVNNKNNNNKAYAIADGFVVAGSIQLSDTDAYILKFGNGTNVWFNLSDTTIKVKAQGNILNGLPLKKEMKIEKIEVSNTNTNVNALDLVSLAQSYSLFYRDFNILPTMPYDPSIERVDDKGNAYKIAFNDMANSYYIFEDQNFKTIKVIAPTISSATIFSDVLPQTLIITDPVPVPPGYRVVQKISLLPGLDSFDYRAEKYSQVILDAAFQIGLRKSENADTLEKLSEIVDLAGFTTSDGKKIGDVLVYGKKELTAIRLKPSEIQTNLKNWEKVVKWGKVAKHLEKLDLALSAASFTTEISGDAFRAMVIYSLANAEAEERLDAIGWFIEMNKDNLDPAIVKGYEIARQKFDKMMGDYYSILQNEILKNRRYVDLAFLTTSLITPHIQFKTRSDYGTCTHRLPHFQVA